MVAAIAKTFSTQLTMWLEQPTVRTPDSAAFAVSISPVVMWKTDLCAREATHRIRFKLPIFLSLTVHFFQNRLHRRISLEQCVAQFVAKLFARLLIPLPRGCQRRISHCRIVRRAQFCLLLHREPRKPAPPKITSLWALGKQARCLQNAEQSRVQELQFNNREVKPKT